MKQGLECPSGLANDKDAYILGAITEDGLVFAEPGIKASEVLELLPTGVLPEEIFRFHSPCATNGCGHYSESRDICTLGERVVANIAPLAMIPRCSIRQKCRWYAEQGSQACLRCPLIATVSDPTELLALVAATPCPV